MLSYTSFHGKILSLQSLLKFWVLSVGCWVIEEFRTQNYEIRSSLKFGYWNLFGFWTLLHRGFGGQSLNFGVYNVRGVAQSIITFLQIRRSTLYLSFLKTFVAFLKLFLIFSRGQSFLYRDNKNSRRMIGIECS